MLRVHKTHDYTKHASATISQNSDRGQNLPLLTLDYTVTMTQCPTSSCMMKDDCKAKRKSLRIKISVKCMKPKPHYLDWMMEEFRREQKLWESASTASESESTANESKSTANESQSTARQSESTARGESESSAREGETSTMEKDAYAWACDPGARGSNTYPWRNEYQAEDR